MLSHPHTGRSFQLPLPKTSSEFNRAIVVTISVETQQFTYANGVVSEGVFAENLMDIVQKVPANLKRRCTESGKSAEILRKPRGNF